MINIFNKIVDKVDNFTRELESIKKDHMEILFFLTSLLEYNCFKMVC